MSITASKIAAQGNMLGGPYALSGGLSVTGQSDDIAYASGIALKIIPANGGTIVSIRFERAEMITMAPDLYVIPEGRDIGAEIGKIITMHHLKKEA